MPNLYESRKYLSEYLLFHYGNRQDLCPFHFAPKNAFHFHRRIAREMIRPVRKPGSRALDLGCAVGRLSFELSRLVDEVIGIDGSRSFIRAARRLAAKRSATFRIQDEGDLSSRRSIRLDPGFRTRRVRFEVGDAQRLRRDLGAFDLVVMANLIDRLPDPQECLRRLPRLVKPGGQLVITSPYSWLAEFTSRKNWLGGIRKKGTMVSTPDGLRKLLGPYFNLVKRRDLPFLIREHRRKFQWVVAEATTWIRSRDG